MNPNRNDKKKNEKNIFEVKGVGRRESGSD